MLWLEQLQSANWAQASGVALAAYIVGCFTTGYYLVRRCLGEDIRNLGSQSIGARNVGRVLGLNGFLLTLLGDFAKGTLAVWTTQHFTRDPRLTAIAMLAVVAGHIWPVQLRFQGGKGVATALGALSVYDYPLVITFAFVFALGVALMRKTVLAGLFAFACLPWLSVYFGHEPSGAVGDYAKISSVFILTGLVLISHRKNLIQEFSDFLDRHKLNPKQHKL